MGDDPLFARAEWRLPDGRVEHIQVCLIREGGGWRVHFYETFRYFCSLKRWLQGQGLVPAFIDAKQDAQQIMMAVGTKGFVSILGTVRNWQGELLGVAGVR
ncbi:MAG: hypothetical protein NZ959_01290 [Armatimonadetes bacterium]|nr:hypothetical protein [Armatimonadota bacterium]MDW8122118.1 hypothetical protein [Armatimonadota bacterium]